MSHHEARSGDANRATLERVLAAMTAQDWDALGDHFADDFVQHWPQSGERVTGKDHCLVIYKNYPGGSPAINPKRITGGGDHWTVESVMTYGDKPTHAIGIFEFRDGKVVSETDYWAESFEAPAWRSQWVTME